MEIRYISAKTTKPSVVVLQTGVVGFDWKMRKEAATVARLAAPQQQQHRQQRRLMRSCSTSLLVKNEKKKTQDEHRTDEKELRADRRGLKLGAKEMGLR